MAYDKMKDYAVTIYSVFRKIQKNAKETNNNKMGYISIMIYNYYLNILKENNFSASDIERDNCIEDVNLIPLFEYISYNQIELFDFSKINMNDVDTSKKQDIERFVLSHIYYLTQK
jgi:hypothetical protein